MHAPLIQISYIIIPWVVVLLLYVFVQVRSAYLRCLENYLTTSFFGATRAARPGAEAGDLGIFTGAVMSTVASAAYET